MSNRRIQSEFGINFDGLTDAVTNLVGALILLIVLILALTKSAGNTSAGSATRWDTFAPAMESGPVPLQPLLRQIVLLQQNIAITNQQMTDLEATMAELRQNHRAIMRRHESPTAHNHDDLFLVSWNPTRGALSHYFSVVLLRCLFAQTVAHVQDSAAPRPTPDSAGAQYASRAARGSPLDQRLAALSDKLKSLEDRLPPLADEVQKMIDELHRLKVGKAPRTPPAAVKKVVYRPPLQRVTRKKPSALIVCENNRLTVFDMSSLQKHAPKLSDLRKQLAEEKSFEHSIDLSGEHFGLRLTFDFKESNGFELSCQELFRKDGSPNRGETIAEISRNNSELRQRMGKLDPRATFVQFAVYSDSHEAFRAARSLVWQMGFEVQWRPQGPGEAIRFTGGGAATVQ